MSAVRPESATASQVTSKKESKMEDKGNNRAQDIRIENFDVAYGNRCVQGCVVFLFLYIDVQVAAYSTSDFSLNVSPNYSLNINQ